MRKSLSTLGRPALIAAALLLANAAAPSEVHAQSRCGSAVTVSPGDTLFQIAQRCATSVSALMDANPGIHNPNAIHVGQTIRMPGRVAARIEPRRRGLGTSGDGHRVRPGDTLYAISRLYGVPVSVLLRLNAHLDPGAIRPGIVIRLPGDREDRRDQGSISVAGIITGEGVECPTMRGPDGRLYTLAGDVGDFEPGDRVRVQGQRAEVSTCMQGTTIDVRRIRSAG